MLKLLKPLTNTKGISIAEILISAFIVAILCAFTLNAFIGQKEASNMQAQVSDAQQASTFSMAELTFLIRNAGYNVPAGTPTSGYEVKVGPLGHDTLLIYYVNDTIRFFLDHTTDAAHPALKKKMNDIGTGEVYAENIEDVDFIPVGTKSLTVSLTARTEDIDKHLNDYRRRTVSSNILIPNAL
jgi:hypothetical protein